MRRSSRINSTSTRSPSYGGGSRSGRGRTRSGSCSGSPGRNPRQDHGHGKVVTLPVGAGQDAQLLEDLAAFASVVA
jgi:hypothetical protein